jgi:hypothetical protein
MQTQLLCTFSKKKQMKQTLESIMSCYEIVFGKIFILKNVENESEIIFSYNINPENIKGSIPPNTISVHRKKDTNTIYTINSLNYVISLLNDGRIDKNFPVPWENFKNCILVVNSEGLKKIFTKIEKIVNII